MKFKLVDDIFTEDDLNNCYDIHICEECIQQNQTPLATCCAAVATILSRSSL